MAKGGGEKGKGADFTVFLLLVGGIGLLMVMFWLIGHNFLSWAMVRSRQHEMAAMGWVLHLFVGENAPQVFAEAYSQSQTVNLSFASTLQVMRESGIYTRWLFVPILFGLGFFLFMYAPTAKYKKSHTMKSLAQQEAAVWPEISPVIDQNLVKGDITKGPWRVSQTEWEFARAHSLVVFPVTTVEEQFTVPGGAKENDAPREQLNREAAHSLFVEQLGPLWKGTKRLPPFIRGIYAALAIRCSSLKLTDSKQIQALLAESDAAFRRMAVDYTVAKGDLSKMDFSWADAAIEKYKDLQLLQMLEVRHAYVYTLMATLLQIARSNGVIGASMFIWLRPVDRRLWYTLNNTGGYTFVPECAGISAHWLTEKEIGVKLLYPSVSEAVVGLERSLQDYIEEDANEALFK